MRICGLYNAAGGMRYLFSVLFFCFCIVSFSEIRLWEDKKGNVLEAEYKCEISGKVILRDRAGNDYKLSISSLSEKDQNYLKTKLPPEIDIEFKKIQNRKKSSYYNSVVSMHGEVILTQTSRMPYSGELKATLFMIGNASYDDEFIMLDRTDFNFNFREGKTHSFVGGRFKMHEYKYSSTNDGVEYRGFLVVVYDKNGAVLHSKTSRDEFERNIEYLSKIKPGSRFPDDLKGKATQSSSSRTYY